MRSIALTSSLLLTLLTTSAIAQTNPRPDDSRRPDENRRPDAEKRADLMGRIIAVSEDGQTLTLAMPPAQNEPTKPNPDARPGDPRPGDPRPEEARVILSDRTNHVFFGVGENEAKPAVGLMAMVWLEPNSKDQAARVRYMKREGEERPDVQGRVVSISPDGKTLNVESRGRDNQPRAQTTVQLASYTQSLYYGVDRDAAKPTVGYQIVAWFEKGSKDTASKVHFMKGDR